MDLTAGMLVEIQGLQQDVRPVDTLQGVIQPLNLNGERAQLVEYDRESRKWIAGTFRGALVAVSENYIRPLSPEAMDGLDFVMGPKSDPELVGQQMADCLSSKGYAAVKVFVADVDTAEMLEVAKRLEEEDQFTRLALEFEPGYLGRGTLAARTLHVDPNSDSAADYVRDSPLRVMDNNFSAISGMLMPHCGEGLGFDVYSRTSLLLRKPILPDDDDKFPPADVDEGDAEGYLHLMHRRQLVVLQFVGPSSGSLKLIPKRAGGEEVRLTAEPNTMVLIHCSQYDYAYEPEGSSLTLQSFYLKAPPIWEMGDVGGNLEALFGGATTGPPPPKEPHIMVPSVHCRYGGGADSRDGYWCICKVAADGATAIPTLRWDYNAYYDPEMKYGGAYTKHGTFGIDGVDLFDSKFFEISPAEAKGMDPVQRQVMEVSYVCLNGAGWDKKSLARKSENIGHFVGIDKDDWMFLGGEVAAQTGGFASSSAANAITSNRFSFSMNLKGASMTIDTACSSGLVCIHVSKMHLRMQDWDPMPASIVNGVNLMLHIGPFLGCCGANMLSHEGRCFTFNVTADGYARGELCGALAFKQEKYDEQVSLACLAGSQVNQDGRSASLTAPNGPSQERCLQAVLRETGLKSSEIDIFECHGTGTSLGDPIEIGSFRKVMSQQNREDVLLMSAHKSMICHGEGGAGLAGFFKCVLQVSHCEVGANPHLGVMNPHIDLSGFPVNAMDNSQTTRDPQAYAGVSSFGFGGTNAHGEAWGKNIMTSRSAINKDPYTTFQSRLRLAPPAEVTINGDEFEDWETTGCDPKAEVGDQYVIHLDVDGIAEWEKVEPDLPDTYGDDFALQGTHNNWTPDEGMSRHESIPGLWVGNIVIGPSGEEEFQVIADGASELIYSPSTARCISKAAPIKGPHKVDKEMSWVVRGFPGDNFKVEFFQQDDTKSIIWMKVKADP
jgi:polyketide synthase-associated protein